MKRQSCKVIKKGFNHMTEFNLIPLYECKQLILLSKIDQKVNHSNAVCILFQNLVAEMSAERRDELVMEIIQSEPQLILDLLTDKGRVTGVGEEGDGDADNTANDDAVLGDNSVPGPSSEPQNFPPWCVCKSCQEMTADQDKVCCGLQPNNCLSKTPEFRVLCLDRMVLVTATRMNNDHYAQSAILNHDEVRFSAYRQFTYWRHGKLGVAKLKVIPSCCLWKIREEFPDPNGQYVPFSLRGGTMA